MRAPVASFALVRPLALALAGIALSVAWVASSAVAEEPTAGPSVVAAMASDGESADGSGASEAPVLAGSLADGMLRVSADVALVDAADGDAAEPVVGSFTVGGLTYAVVGEGQVALVAVSPRTLAGGLAGGSAAGLASASDGGSSGAPSGEGSGSGVPPRSEAEQVPSGAASPSPSPEGASSDGVEDEGASEPVNLEVPESVEYDGAAYSVTSIGPRALAGCDADVVTIPATVESVDELAFRGSAVAAIEVADGNPSFSSYDGMLFDADQTSLLLIPEGKQGAARIPKTASAITPDAFSHCASVTSVEVEAGSAAFYSENGCLYDVTGEMLLYVPLVEGVTWKREQSLANGVIENTRVYPDSRDGDLTVIAQKAISGAGTSNAIFGETIRFEDLPYWPFVTRPPYYVLSLNPPFEENMTHGAATQWIRGPFRITIDGYTYALPSGDWRVEASVSRPGYVFDGWLIDSENGQAWREPSPISDRDFFPSWQPGRFELTRVTGEHLNQKLKSVYVTFSKGFHAEKADSHTLISQIPPPTETEYHSPGKSFAGWWTLTEGGSWDKQVTDGDGNILVTATEFTKNTVICSRWGAPFSATFDPAYGKLDIVHVVDGCQATESALTPHETKWSYATVKRNGYVATSYEEGGHYYWCSIMPTKAGWTFCGWEDEHGNLLSELATGPDDLQQAITPGATYKAKWGLPLTATLDAGDGTIKVWEGQKNGNPPLSTYQKGTITWNDSTRIYGNGCVQYYLKADDGTRAGSEAWAERDGYTFKGWEIQYADEDSIDGPPGPTNLTGTDSRDLRPGATYEATWGAPYKATFRPNGGVLSVCHIADGNEGRWLSSEDHEVRWEFARVQDGGFVATSNTLGESLWCSLEPVNEGRTFLGWIDEDGNDLLDGSSGLGSLTPGATYTARWDTHRYRVAFDPAGGAWDDAGAGGAVSAAFDQDVTLAAAPKRAGYVFAGWEVTGPDGAAYSFDAGATLAGGKLKAAEGDASAVPISYGERAVEGQEPAATATFTAKWVADLRVDVPISVDLDLTVDWEQGRVVASGPDGSEHATGEFRSWSSGEVQVAAFGQEAATAMGHRQSALGLFASGDEAKAENLSKVSLALSADADGAQALSFPLSGLYELPADPPHDAMASSQDLSSLDLVVPPASSAASPGTLKVRYGIDCAADLPLSDVAIDERPRPILKLVYEVGLA